MNDMYSDGANGTAERLSGASDAKKDDGTRYHIIRDGILHMTVKGSELKDTDIVKDVYDPDSRTQLVADIQAWLEGNVGFSVWLTDLIEQVHGWLNRQAAITERECANTRVNFAERIEFVNRIEELKAGRRRQAETISRLSSENDNYRDEVDRLQRRNDELRTSYDKLKRERDALADDLKECMEERAYWKQEVQYCMDAAYPPSHAPERPYDTRVMAYPDREGCTTPSTLVTEVIDGLRDDVRDMVMPIIEESANAKADCERWREACGSMMDVAHEIERIMREMETR